MKEETQASHLCQGLEREVVSWEDRDQVTLAATFGEEYFKLTQALSKLQVHPGTARLQDVKESLGAIRKRLSILRIKSLPTTPTVAPTLTSTDPSAVTKRENKKLRTIPLPVFKGKKATFWKRFVDALARIDDLTEDEFLTLLLDSLKDRAAQTVVSRAIRDGQTLNKVEKTLKEFFDRP